MGRNRKAVRTRRDFGELIDIKVLENGTLYGRVELKYRLEGTQECSVILTAHKLMPRITVDLRLHKDSVWEPENLYLSLPFAKDGDTVYMDKAGAVFRPLLWGKGVQPVAKSVYVILPIAHAPANGVSLDLPVGQPGGRHDFLIL